MTFKFLGMLTGHKKLDLIMKSSDGDRNIAVALAAIWTIILFANKTVGRRRFSGRVVLRMNAMSVRSETTHINVIQGII